MKRFITLACMPTLIIASSPSLLQDLEQALQNIEQQSPPSIGTPSKKLLKQQEVAALQLKLSHIQEHCQRLSTQVLQLQKELDADRRFLSSTGNTLCHQELEQQYTHHHDQFDALQKELGKLNLSKISTDQQLQREQFSLAVLNAKDFRDRIRGIEEALAKRQEAYERNQQHLLALHDRMNGILPRTSSQNEDPSDEVPSELANAKRGGPNDLTLEQTVKTVTAGLQELDEDLDNLQEEIFEIQAALNEAFKRDTFEEESWTFEKDLPETQHKEAMSTLVHAAYPDPEKRNAFLASLYTPSDIPQNKNLPITLNGTRRHRQVAIMSIYLHIM